MGRTLSLGVRTTFGGFHRKIGTGRATRGTAVKLELLYKIMRIELRQV
jgi:hypothetical protein